MDDSISEAQVDQTVIDLPNIKKSAYGYDPESQYCTSSVSSIGGLTHLGCPRTADVCLELWQPPRFERQQRLRAYSGDRRKDKRDFRERLPHLGGDHEPITPYAFQIRLLLHDPQTRHAFKSLCEEAGIRTPSKVTIATVSCGIFQLGQAEDRAAMDCELRVPLSLPA